MSLKNLFITALRSLNKNKLRSVLTSLGVIIGVASVILMVGIGNSARIAVRDKINNYGTNAMSVQSMPDRFTNKDIEKMKRAVPLIKDITPFINGETRKAKYESRFLNTRVYGVNNDYFKIKEWPLQYGRQFTDLEILSLDKVAIIGNTVKVALYGGIDPVGKIVTIDNIPFHIVGSLIELGQALSGRDFDNLILLPYTTTEVKISGKRTFDEMYVSTFSESTVFETVKEIKKYLVHEHTKPGAIRIKTSQDMLQMVEYVSKTLSVLLAGIASISLIVGGIGIMNIMLVSVSERTREIGIRMAIGAKKLDILIQFLIEAMTLSAGGGIIGIIFALTVYFLITYFLNWPFLFSFFSIMISFLFSCAVGIFFGYYPAKKASNLKPIEALRYE